MQFDFSELLHHSYISKISSKKYQRFLEDIFKYMELLTLSSDQLQRIRTLILEDKPEQYGFKDKRWTGPILAKWIKNEYGVEYQKAQLYKILANVGITFKGKLGLIENDINV